MSHEREEPGPRQEIRRIDCRGRKAREVLLDLMPQCAEATSSGRLPVVCLDHLEGLSDSVTRFLKAVDCFASDLGGRLKVADSSGLGKAFLGALPDRGHFDLQEE